MKRFFAKNNEPNENTSSSIMDEKSQRLLQTGLIGYYIPHRMWVVLASFSALVFWMREDLHQRFMAHASLNGLIVCTGIMVIVIAFQNMFSVQRSATLLRDMEAFEDIPAEDQRVDLLRRLRSSGKLIDTFYMQQALAQFSDDKKHLVFDDNQARLIKSKVGQRCTNMRNNVAYLAGVLVMLGLIGTFWGLLSTITSVGDAMSSITGAFAGGGEGGDGMVEFLNAISKPLQGMGVAFSASLFGLSGSLVGGLLNSFGAKGMDRFIENLSVWLDTRIPPKKVVKEKQLNPVEIIEQHNIMVVQAVEKALTNMHDQSEKLTLQFSNVLGEFAGFAEVQRGLVTKLTDENRNSGRLAHTLEMGVASLGHDAEEIRESLAALPALKQVMEQQFGRLEGALAENLRTLAGLQQPLHDQLAETMMQRGQDNATMNHLIEVYGGMIGVQERLIQAIHGAQKAGAPDNNNLLQSVYDMQESLREQLAASRRYSRLNMQQAG